MPTGSTNGAGDTLADQGKSLFIRYGCAGCHLGGGTVRAPSLAGLYGSPVPLSDGSTVIADDRYIRDSILYPKQQIVASFEPIMPSFANVIPEDDLVRLVAYIDSLAAGERTDEPDVVPQSQISYLSDGVSLRSWLLTTDHKRIAILYMISITVFFFLGGSAAALIRYNLIVPEGMIRSAETYNRLFTMHGIIMVWFFLVPAVPVTIGNFVVPLMLGARDLAFPKLNLASWYLFMAGGFCALYALFCRRRRYRMDILYAAVQQLCPGPCRCGGRRRSSSPAFRPSPLD